MGHNILESLQNIVLVCEKHASKSGKYVGQDPNQFLHKFVKLGFPSPQGTEHMWIFVERVGEQGDVTELEGTLANDPINDVGYEHGTYIGFDVEEIEDVHES